MRIRALAFISTVSPSAFSILAMELGLIMCPRYIRRKSCLQTVLAAYFSDLQIRCFFTVGTVYAKVVFVCLAAYNASKKQHHATLEGKQGHPVLGCFLSEFCKVVLLLLMCRFALKGVMYYVKCGFMFLGNSASEYQPSGTNF